MFLGKGNENMFKVKLFYNSKFLDFNTAENISESLVSEGLVTVRRESARNSPDIQRLIELEDAAKAAGKGRWGNSPSSVIFHICVFDLLNKKTQFCRNTFVI